MNILCLLPSNGTMMIKTMREKERMPTLLNTGVAGAGWVFRGNAMIQCCQTKLLKRLENDQITYRSTLVATDLHLHDCCTLLLTDCLYSQCLNQRTSLIHCHGDWAAELSCLGSSISGLTNGKVTVMQCCTQAFHKRL